MGTVLKLYVEKRVGNEWVFVPATATRARTTVSRSETPDWYHDQGQQCYEDMAVLANVRNSDHIPAISTENRGLPEGMSAGLQAVADYHGDSDSYPTWLCLDEIKRYDFDQTVTKPARLIQPDELARLGWLGNSDGTAYLDIVRRDYHGRYGDGYTLQEFPVRQFVGGLLDKVIPAIEAACGAKPEDIRLTMWFC